MTILTAGLLLFAGTTSAHVTVKPTSSSPNAWETYTITVPVEKDIATTKMTLQIPQGVQFELSRTMPGWRVETTKNDAGQITTVTWSSEGNGIQPGEFEKFEFMAKNPAEETSINWDAIQYYSDGSNVSWTGESNSPTPHSVTTISANNAAGSDAHVHGDQHTGNHSDSSHDHSAMTQENGTAKTSGSVWVSIILSAASLLISLLALWAAFNRSPK